MERIGIIVGNGKLPLYFIEEAQRKNIEVFPIGLFDTIDEEIKKIKNCKNDWRVRNEKTECMEVV